MNVNVMVELEIILSIFEIPTRVTRVISRRMHTNALELCSPERSQLLTKWRRPMVTDGNKRYWETRLGTLLNYKIIMENTIFVSFLSECSLSAKISWNKTFTEIRIKQPIKHILMAKSNFTLFIFIPFSGYL